MATFTMDAQKAKSYIYAFQRYMYFYRWFPTDKRRKAFRTLNYFLKKKKEGRENINRYLEVCQRQRKVESDLNIAHHKFGIIVSYAELNGISSVTFSEEEMFFFNAMFNDYDLIFAHEELRKRLGKLRGMEYEL